MRLRLALPLLTLLLAVFGAGLVLRREVATVQEALPHQALAAAQPARPAVPSPAPARAKPQPATAIKLKPIPAFIAWLANYQAAPPASRAVLLPEGLALAEQRAAVLHDLIASDPRAALEAALRESQRRELPASFGPWLEERINARGDLAMVAAKAPRGRSAQRAQWREARFEDRVLEAFTYGPRDELQTLYGASLHGIALRGRMAVSDSPAQIIERAELPLGVALEKPTALGEHAAAGVATADTQSAPVVSADGRHYPVCCADHAGTLASRWQRAELGRSGPYVQLASGGTSANQPLDLPVLPQRKAHVEGAKTALVILADFSDAPGRPKDYAYKIQPEITEAYAISRVLTEGGSWFNEVSYGKLSVSSVAVTPVLRLPNTLRSYATTGNHAGMKTAAIAAATGAGFDPANYDRTILVFSNTDRFFTDPMSGPFFWAGLADLGGNFVWVNGWFDLETVLHELMHTMGLPHANLWTVGTTAQPFASNGRSTEYGDKFDIMGDTVTQAGVNQDPPNPWYLRTLGWLPPSSVQTITSSGSYRVHRYDIGSADLASTLALRIPRNHTTDYWLSYRFKPGADLATGAYVIWGYRKLQSSNLIDCDTPGTNVWDAPLNIGRTLNDTTAGISITVTGQGGSAPAQYLDIDVSFSPRIAFSQPTYFVDEAAGSVTLTVERLSNATGNVSVDFSTLNNSAVAPADYTAVSGKLVWPAGDMAPKYITIPIKPDALPEGGSARPDAFFVRLSNNIGGIISSSKDASVLIHEAGATDKTFDPAALTNSVTAIDAEPTGAMIVAGNFGIEGDSGVAVAGLARLESTGRFDEAYDQEAGPDVNPITAMARQPNGQLIIAGSFTEIRGIARSHIARLNADGTLDGSLNASAGPDGPIRCLAVQPDGKILVGGAFATWDGQPRPGLVRLNNDGSLDTSFAAFGSIVSAVSGSLVVHALALAPAATVPHFAIFAGGLFQRAPTGTSFRSGLVKLNADGSQDTSFSVVQGAHADGSTSTLQQVSSLAVQLDGKLLVGGQFTAFNGVKAGRFIRLLANGSNDSAFITATKGGMAPAAAGSYCDVISLWPRNDGKIIAAGSFATTAGLGYSGAACFGPTGVLDPKFRIELGLASGVDSLAVLPDHRLLLGLHGAHPDALRRAASGLASQPGALGFASAMTTAQEGSELVLAVHRVGGSIGALSVNYHTVPLVSDPSLDYLTSSGTLTWAAGDSAPKVIGIPVHADSTAEGTETFAVQLGLPLGGALLGDHAACTVRILDSHDIATLPTVQFASSSSTVSEGSSVGMSIEVTLSAASAEAITVPLSLAGTAAPGIDYLVAGEATPSRLVCPGWQPAALTFAAGETSKSLVIQPRDDFSIDAADLTVQLSLGRPQGAALPGTMIQHTLTLDDDEAHAAIVHQPQPQIAALRGITTLSVTASGVPAPTYQWRKANKPIAGATSASYVIPDTQLSHAGSYSVAVTNLGVTIISNAITLAVADQTPRARPLNDGASTSLALAVAGTGLTYRWEANGVPLADTTRFKGTGTKTLSLAKLTSADTALYRCRISSNFGAPQVYGMPTDVGVIDTIPAIDAGSTLPAASVGMSYDVPPVFVPVDPSARRAPTSYSASGLPPGLTLNTATGQITGTPMIALTSPASYDVTLNATNFKGTATAVKTLTVNPLPTTVIGSYTGTIARHNALNNFLGGRLDLTVTASSAFTGTLVLGGSSHPFTGAMQIAASTGIAFADFNVTRSSRTPARVRFTIDPGTQRWVSASVADSATPSNLATLTGWKHAYSASTPTAIHPGYYTFGAFCPSSHNGYYNTPQGISFGSFTISADGSYSLTAKLADGSAITQTGGLGPAAELPVYASLYTATGSVLGELGIITGSALDYSDNAVTGGLNWSKKAQTTTTLIYKAGYYVGSAEAPYTMPVRGGRYIDPATISSSALVMDLPDQDHNAKLLFPATTGEYWPTTLNPSILSRVLPGGALASPLVDPNPHALTLSINASTGSFDGTFNVNNAPPGRTTPLLRNAIYQGIIIRDGSSPHGVGYFLLPGFNAVYTTSSTRVFSNPIYLEAN